MGSTQDWARPDIGGGPGLTMDPVPLAAYSSEAARIGGILADTSGRVDASSGPVAQALVEAMGPFGQGFADAVGQAQQQLLAMMTAARGHLEVAGDATRQFSAAVTDQDQTTATAVARTGELIA